MSYTALRSCTLRNSRLTPPPCTHACVRMPGVCDQSGKAVAVVVLRVGWCACACACACQRAREFVRAHACWDLARQLTIGRQWVVREAEAASETNR